MAVELKKRVQEFDTHLKRQLMQAGYNFPPPNPNGSLFRPIVDKEGDRVGFLVSARV